MMSKKNLLIYIVLAIAVVVAVNVYRGHISTPKPQETKPHVVPAKPMEGVKPTVDPQDTALIEHYTEEIKKGGNDAENYYQRALVNQRIKQYNLAIQDYTNAIKANPDSANAYFNRALTYYQEAILDNAVADFTSAIKLKPNDARIYNARGLAYIDQNNLDAAMSDLNQSLTLDPNYGSAAFNRGTVNERMQKYKEALADYDNAIKNNKAEFDKEDPKAITARLLESYYRRSIMNFNLNDINAAMHDINYVIEQNPKIAKAFELRSKLYSKVGNTSEAANDESTAQNLNIENMMQQQ